MSQGALVVANGSGAAVRAAINAALARLATKASGTARPADIAAGESWFETDNPGGGIWSLWLWDGAQDALLGTFNTASNVFLHSAATFGGLLTTQGDLLIRGVSTAERLAAGADPYRALFTGGGAANPAWHPAWKGHTVNAVAASVIEWTGIPATVNHLFIVGSLEVGTDAATISGRTAGADGNFDTGATDYGYNFQTNGSGVSSGQASGMPLAAGIDSSNNFGAAFQILLSDIQAANETKAIFNSVYLDTGGATSQYRWGASWRLEDDRITGYRIFPSGGTVTGRFTAYMSP